jgi:hypothetical protein
MLYALLLFVPALAAIAYVLRRPSRQHVVVAEAVAEPAEISGEVDAISALEALLAELERATLDERDVGELERLAEQLEATAAELERVG